MFAAHQTNYSLIVAVTQTSIIQREAFDALITFLQQQREKVPRKEYTVTYATKYVLVAQKKAA